MDSNENKFDSKKSEPMAVIDLSRHGVADLNVDKNTNSIGSFEDVLHLIKPLGVWQGWIFFWMAIISFFQAMTNLAVVFFQITPEYACDLPLHKANWTFDQVLNISAPYDSKEDEFDACKLFNRSYSDLGKLSFSQAVQEVDNDSALIYCSHWRYDTTVDMKRTIVTDWDLICDKKFYTEHSQLVYMGGYLVGSFVSGIISDKIGRKPTMIGAAILFSIFGIVESFAPTYAIFLVFRFLMSLSNIATTMASYCLILETVTSNYRSWVGGLAYVPYAMGYTSLALVAYLTKDWRTMHLIITTPCLISLGYWWIIPESPKWLLLQGKVKEAEKELRKAARINKRKLPHDINFQKIADALRHEHKQEETKRIYLYHAFRYKTLAFRGINLFFNWFVNAMVYYGISLNVSSFAGDRFINNAIAGAVELPGNIICVPLLYWSRKKGLALTLILAGVSLFIVPWIPITWLKTALAMTGKLCITASFTIVYTITTELYPTVVRNSGLATSSCVARVGSMIAPYIAGISKLGKSVAWVPMIVFGSFSLAAGALTLFLPETTGRKMPEQLEDAIKLQKYISHPQVVVKHRVDFFQRKKRRSNMNTVIGKI